MVSTDRKGARLMEFFSLLLGTFVLRPYVFVFLAVFLFISCARMGWVRTLLFLVIAYCIAFLSEFSSTRNGFPYGFYSYIDTTRGQELWIANVPFMDSLSYSFLSYVAYSLSLLFWGTLKGDGWKVEVINLDAIKNSVRVLLTAAMLFMLMDVIIDPVAFLGDRWFLGKIYTYQEEGEYFNIPLTNFAGWFIVGFAILFTYTRILMYLESRFTLSSKGTLQIPGKALMGPALYYGVLVFNLAVTFYIGEIVLGLAGSLLFMALFSATALKVYQKRPFSPGESVPPIGNC